MHSRVDAPRFAPGTRVVVIPPAVSSHVGSVGEVASVLMSPSSSDLDKYAVSFGDAEVEVFWDVQLEKYRMPLLRDLRGVIAFVEREVRSLAHKRH